MSDFSVQHGSYAEVNTALAHAVQQMGTILEDLNGFLRGMGDATQGQALPLWGERQQKWTQAYQDMNLRLSSGASASNSAADAFLDGDRKGQQIMM
jgi:uncharacterized protein YukE